MAYSHVLITSSPYTVHCMRQQSYVTSINIQSSLQCNKGTPHIRIYTTINCVAQFYKLRWNGPLYFDKNDQN